MTAHEVGLLARRLTIGSYVHAASMDAIRSPSIDVLAPPTDGDEVSPAGVIERLDGTTLAYDWSYAVDAARTDTVLRQELDRAWLVNALVVLGDRLAAEGYFDRAPILEMVRHLRNGVGHGNRFEIRKSTDLGMWPAHTREAAHRGQRTFEITPDLHGATVLFDYMGPGDVVDVLISAGTHLLAD